MFSVVSTLYLCTYVALVRFANCINNFDEHMTEDTVIFHQELVIGTSLEDLWTDYGIGVLHKFTIMKESMTRYVPCFQTTVNDRVSRFRNIFFHFWCTNFL